MPERVTFVTDDGVELVGDFYTCAQACTGAALLLHMMPRTRGSWKPLAEKLEAAGVSVLAIDQRGHGESIHTTLGRTLDYETFSDSQQQGKILDVDAAIHWLQSEKKISIGSVAIVGASIGANLAIRYAADHHQITHIVAVAPGINYRGVITDDAMTKLSASQSVLMIGAHDDDRDAYQSIETLMTIGPAKKQKVIFKSGGHGTALFETHPEVIDRIVAFVRSDV